MKRKLLVKCCGMKETENIAEVAQLPLDYMGFIFYSKSSRYNPNLTIEQLQTIPNSIQKVGVFVDSSVEAIITQCNSLGLTVVQLHSQESPEDCRSLKEKGYVVIKAIAIADVTDLTELAKYEGVCDYFLFDTKCACYGGSGKYFDWSLLTNYQGHTPFFLSGGIGEQHLQKLIDFDHPLCVGVDINSQFEKEPGVKEVRRLQLFIDKIRRCKLN